MKPPLKNVPPFDPEDGDGMRGLVLAIVVSLVFYGILFFVLIHH